MSRISEYLNQILSAVYGKDVRQSIHDSIKEIWGIATGAQSSATSAANTAISKASAAAASATAAAQSESNAAESEANAKMYAENASAVADVQIADKDTAGLVKGGDNLIGSDGELILTRTTTSPTLPNSHAGGIKLVGVKGASNQDSTTGAQLFDADSLVTVNAATFSVDGNEITVTGTSAYAGVAYIIRDATAYAGQTLTLSRESTSESNSDASVILQIRLTLSDGTNKYYYVTSSTGVSFIVPTDTSSIAIILNANNSATALDTANTAVFKGVMLNVGDTALPWEPYTGNAPSPSMEYPQEIKKSVVSEIVTRGKNLLTVIEQGTISATDGTNVANGFNGRSKEYMKVKPNILYTFSSNVALYTLRISEYKKDFTHIQRRETNNATAFGVVLSEETEYVRISFNYDNSKTNVTNEVVKKLELQFEMGEATDYEPYTEFSHTLSQPIELNGIGDVVDELIPSDVKRHFAEVVFDGSDDEIWQMSVAADGTYRLGNFDLPKYVKYPKNNSTKANILCSHFSAKTANDTWMSKEGISVQAEVGYLFIYSNEFNTEDCLDAWKAHLAENPITVVYELAEPVTEELPTADQIALNSLKSFDGTTHIYCDCGEVQATMEVEYGTSRVGALALDNHCRENVNEIKLAELTALTNSLATAVVAGSEV